MSRGRRSRRTSRSRSTPPPPSIDAPQFAAYAHVSAPLSPTKPVGLAEGGIERLQHTKPVVEHRSSGDGDAFVPHVEGDGVGSPPLLLQQGVSLPDRPLVVLLVGAGLRPQLCSQIVEVRPTQARTALDEVEVVRLKRNNRDLGQHVSIALWSFPVHQHTAPTGPRQFHLNTGGSRLDDELAADDRLIGAVPDDGIVRSARGRTSGGRDRPLPRGCSSCRPRCFR